jgi:hypothetical protein
MSRVERKNNSQCQFEDFIGDLLTFNLAKRMSAVEILKNESLWSLTEEIQEKYSDYSQCEISQYETSHVLVIFT